MPARTFLPDGSPGRLAGADHDEGAMFVIIFGTNDTPVDLLRGGEAMAALLPEATAEAVSTAALASRRGGVAPTVAAPAPARDPVSRTRSSDWVTSLLRLPVAPRRAASETIRIDE
jgi:hypothetical protein